jgi:hypothetical protein
MSGNGDGDGGWPRERVSFVMMIFWGGRRVLRIDPWMGAVSGAALFPHRRRLTPQIAGRVLGQLHTMRFGDLWS